MVTSQGLGTLRSSTAKDGKDFNIKKKHLLFVEHNVNPSSWYLMQEFHKYLVKLGFVCYNTQSINRFSHRKKPPEKS